MEDWINCDWLFGHRSMHRWPNLRKEAVRHLEQMILTTCSLGLVGASRSLHESSSKDIIRYNHIREQVISGPKISL